MLGLVPDHIGRFVSAVPCSPATDRWPVLAWNASSKPLTDTPPRMFCTTVMAGFVPGCIPKPRQPVPNVPAIDMHEVLDSYAIS